MNIFIRVDSSYKIGSGHVMRCLTLADCLRQWGDTIHFICRNAEGSLIKIIRKNQYKVHVLPGGEVTNLADDAAETIKILKDFKQKIDWLIVDHYGLDKSWEKQLRDHVKQILVIDDLANREHDCDLLLDQTLGRENREYISWVPSDCQLLLGPTYALISAQFSKLRHSSLERRKNNRSIKNVLVSLGGTDPKNVTGHVLEIISKKNIGLKFDVILPPSMQYASYILQKRYPDFIHIHSAGNPLANYMLHADIAIGAGGITAWERCCLGLPTLLIVTAENQIKVAAELNRAKAVKLLGNSDELDEKYLMDTLEEWIQHPEIACEMSCRAATICDGYGVRRVASVLMPQRARDDKTIYFRAAKLEDKEILLQWQQHPSTRQYARNPNPPTAEEHQRWFTQRLVDSNCLFHMIMHGSQPAGMLRLDRVSHEENTYEISILTAPEFRNLNIASGALKLICKMFPEFNFHAEVLPGNQASHALFSKAGFTKQRDGNYVVSARIES